MEGLEWWFEIHFLVGIRILSELDWCLLRRRNLALEVGGHYKIIQPGGTFVQNFISCDFIRCRMR